MKIWRLRRGPTPDESRLFHAHMQMCCIFRPAVPVSLSSKSKRSSRPVATVAAPEQLFVSQCAAVSLRPPTARVASSVVRSGGSRHDKNYGDCSISVKMDFSGPVKAGLGAHQQDPGKDDLNYCLARQRTPPRTSFALCAEIPFETRNDALVWLWRGLWCRCTPCLRGRDG